jgi:L-ribulose-5-phosphate 3-epimerase
MLCALCRSFRTTNLRHQTGTMYHTHSGTGVVGASIWDLYILLKDFDPNAVGVNYDVGHAVIEGGVGGWINSFHIFGPHLRGIAVKAFIWAEASNGDWKPQWKPLGSGMVHLPQFFTMIADSGFSGPLQLDFEYRLGGETNSSGSGIVNHDSVYSEMKRDLNKLRGYLTHAHL